MKFAQYLSDTQTPEWKKAYIDYRGLKKRITAIRKSQEGANFHVLDSDEPEDANPVPAAPRPSDATASTRQIEAEEAVQTEPRKSLTSRLSFRRIAPSRMTSSSGNPHANPLAALPLHELLAQLSPVELSFFTMIDAQLEKVESFYLAREKEMLSLGRTLQTQLGELNEHRKLFDDAHRRDMPWQKDLIGTLRSRIGIYPVLTQEGLTRNSSRQPSVVTKRQRRSPPRTPPFVEFASGPSSTAAPTIPIAVKNSSSTDNDTFRNDEEDVPGVSNDSDDEPSRPLPLSADPDSYMYAKRKLKKAVTEHYKGLELLHNYRILNITGFRKALKKFEKVTKIPLQNQYMTNRVEKSAFASDKAVLLMMDEMEGMYAAAFSRGNRKRARKRLRGGNNSKNHHFSTFRSGLLIGLAAPAFVDGFVHVFQPHTREVIPHWDVLLFFYGMLVIPVLFSLLVGFNLLVWANARINYAFIFELDVATQLDHREYFELPSILLASLMYAFWLSFTLTGYPTVSPTIWPLVWLAFAFIVLFEPLPVTFRSSRYWLVRIVARLFVSGTKRVEFTDFWMGDQFCSQIFTISNLYFLICTYSHNFSDDFDTKCSASSDKWPIAFALTSIPLVIRLVQSVKRFVDSGLVTHLINGGKYGCGVIAYLFYFMWRHNGLRHGPIFALWILTNVFYSSYALSWDLLMDWSVLKVRSKPFLLRPELVYTNHTSLYYFAIISNTILRFIWVIYIPSTGPDMMLRTFIGGFLEMLRRWQWNFFRLENEHLGNMDQYRVTREVPLPYAVDDRNRDTEDKDDEDEDMAVRKKRH